VRLEGLGQLKKSTSSGLKPVTFQLVNGNMSCVRNNQICRQAVPFSSKTTQHLIAMEMWKALHKPGAGSADTLFVFLRSIPV
jgi:hypothetical protein